MLYFCQYMNYSIDHCNVPGCTKQIYRNYMCDEHYNFYLSDTSCRKLSDEVVSLQSESVSKRTMIKTIRDFFIHHLFNIPVYRCEHFPLEHVYIWCLRNLDKRDKDKCEKVIKDFDIPENENTSLFRRLVDAANIDKMQIKPLENYLLSEKELIARWPLIISLISFVCIYIQLRFMDGRYIEYIFGMSNAQTIDYFTQLSPYIFSLIIIMYIGTKLSTYYNNIVSRAYNLDMFERVEDNIAVLAQAMYIKCRNLKNLSYTYSIYGCFIGTIISIMWYYFKTSDLTFVSLLFVISCLTVVLPIAWVFNKTVLYFPVFESIKRKHPKILLYNADHNGGLHAYQCLLFDTFIYNEGIIVIVLELLGIFHHWFVSVILWLCLLNRANHAGWSVIMYIISIVRYHKTKQLEKEKLTLSQDPLAFDKAEKLDRVYPSRMLYNCCRLFLIIIIPYLINHMDDIWYDIMELLVSR